MHLSLGHVAKIKKFNMPSIVKWSIWKQICIQEITRGIPIGELETQVECVELWQCLQWRTTTINLDCDVRTHGKFK